VVYGFDPALKEEIIFKTGALYEPLEKAAQEVDLIIIANNNNRFFEKKNSGKCYPGKKESCIIP